MTTVSRQKSEVSYAEGEKDPHVSEIDITPTQHSTHSLEQASEQKVSRHTLCVLCSELDPSGTEPIVEASKRCRIAGPGAAPTVVRNFGNTLGWTGFDCHRAVSGVNVYRDESLAWAQRPLSPQARSTSKGEAPKNVSNAVRAHLPFCFTSCVFRLHLLWRIQHHRRRPRGQPNKGEEESI
eukprot:7812601-Pyramimonas_sp.AAC.1